MKLCLLPALLASYHVLATSQQTDLDHARDLLAKYQLVDTHVDTQLVMRVLNRRPMDMIPDLGTGMPGHFDIPRAKQGGLGGVFFAVWTPCQAALGRDIGPDYLVPDDTVRDAIESIDLVRAMIEHHNTSLQLTTTVEEAEAAFQNGKIAAWIGMEGSHMLGGSLSTIRMMAALGVRYLTLTHICHSPFASSAGWGISSTGTSLPARDAHNGLTSLGQELIRELNRLGVLVDLSHTSEQTMLDTLAMTDVPVAFTHSGARKVWDHPRNVPESVLDLMGPGKNNGIIHSVFYPPFVDPSNATLARVVDHVEYIASRTSKKNVGLGSDFDGMAASVEGMEDVSKWPNMIAEFIRRGWTDDEIADLMGRNLHRVMREVEVAGARLRATTGPSHAIYEARTDLPSPDWGGENGAYLAPKVKALVGQRIRDEL